VPEHLLELAHRRAVPEHVRRARVQPGDPEGPRTDDRRRRRDRVHSRNGDQATTAASPLKRGMGAV
jgi:hypothetical protein